MSSTPLVPASELAARAGVTIPGESAAYRRARTALLAEEIELRRQLERVAELRRALPPGAPIEGDYRFQGEHGSADFADLFGDKQTLIVYGYMFGAKRERPCPMCTSMLGAWEGEARDLEQRVALAVIAGAPIERLLAFKRERGWRDLPLYTDLNGHYTRDFRGITDDGSDMPSLNVFTRRDGIIRHFWGEEMTFPTADPGQDPRGAPGPMLLWTLLDMTPEGRGTDWYPKLQYD
jgi:predicted dithiol-disulfide oxidoreductase (DUF899 family)